MCLSRNLCRERKSWFLKIKIAFILRVKGEQAVQVNTGHWHALIVALVYEEKFSLIARCYFLPLFPDRGNRGMCWDWEQQVCCGKGALFLHPALLGCGLLLWRIVRGVEQYESYPSSASQEELENRGPLVRECVLGYKQTCISLGKWSWESNTHCVFC